MGARHRENIEVAITNIGKHDLLLGTDWLQAHNPSIDWVRCKIRMDRCPATCFPPAPEEPKDPMLGYLLPSLDWEEQYDDLIEAHYEGIDVSHHVLAHAHSYLTPVVGRTTVSTSLAKNAVKDRFQGIPPAFRKYKKVFSDEEAQRLPQHRPWDHKIDLIPGGQMAKTTVYRLTPPEKVALREYIDDGLKRGTLRRSEAPDACSFFFIDKKDGKLRPVQDYRPLNAITRKNVAPIPLIPELIDKLLGARFFTKLDVRWGYNNIRIREGDEWKTAFKTPMGLYESLVMNFGLCNAPATFQTFMDEQFKDLVGTGHVVVYLDDVLIFADNEAELEALTHKVLQRFLDLDLFLRPEKCTFNRTSVEYLGIIISEGELRMDPVKLEAVRKLLRSSGLKVRRAQSVFATSRMDEVFGVSKD